MYYNLEFTDKDTMLIYSEEEYATFKRLGSDTANTGNTNVSKNAICGTFRTPADKDDLNTITITNKSGETSQMTRGEA